jgi:hypothetical protein
VRNLAGRNVTQTPVPAANPFYVINASKYRLILMKLLRSVKKLGRGFAQQQNCRVTSRSELGVSISTQFTFGHEGRAQTMLPSYQQQHPMVGILRSVSASTKHFLLVVVQTALSQQNAQSIVPQNFRQELTRPNWLAMSMIQLTFVIPVKKGEVGELTTRQAAAINTSQTKS